MSMDPRDPRYSDTPNVDTHPLEGRRPRGPGEPAGAAVNEQGEVMTTREQRYHLTDRPHDELVGSWCECGDGPFDARSWDEHRMAILGELPLTVIEEQILDELDGDPSASRRRVLETALTRSAETSTPLVVMP